MVADIDSGSTSSQPSSLTVYDNKLYFAADDGVHGEELWVYNGTEPPKLVDNINALDNPSAPSFLTVYNNKLY